MITKSQKMMNNYKVDGSRHHKEHHNSKIRDNKLARKRKMMSYNRFLMKEILKTPHRQQNNGQSMNGHPNNKLMVEIYSILLMNNKKHNSNTPFS